MLLSPWFAVAGLVLAAGPIAIHLLNRQRFRVVQWAAMEFLRQAVRRSRRMMRLQDLVLLAVRVLCVLLFGLAMARPYFVSSGEGVDPNQPVHAVLLVDNSLSMGYEQLGRTVLDEAKARAKEFIDRLPPGSRVSVIPVCASSRDFSLGAYSTKEDASEALASIEPADRSATAAAALELAKEACHRTPSPPNKQIVLLSDQQAANWPAQSLDAQVAQLGGPLQVVELAPKAAENAWIADFRLQDGIADLESPAVFLATVRFEGTAPRRDVQVSLSLDGTVFATQTVDLEPGQAREVRFPPYRFNQPLQPGQVTFVPAEVSIPRDHLAMDDRRVLAAPLVSALPVVMVDPWGTEESPERSRFGETRRLRQLLAPVTARQGRDPQLIRIRQAKFDQIDREMLKDARLVVVAGVRSPEPADVVRLLREYVEQGGSLVLAAGGDFSPADWTQGAWLDGSGILPAPLKPDPIGSLPTEASRRIEPFQLDVSGLVHEYFLLEQTPREELESLYRRPLFFKAVEADMAPAVIDGMVRNVASRIEKDRSKPQETNEGIPPQWLLWASSLPGPAPDSLPPAELAEKTRPHVLASYTNQMPFLIERDIGRGRVLLFTTGVFRDWNTLTITDAVVIFDRILRDLLQRSLPRRNLASTGQMTFPVPSDLRAAQFTLADPGGHEEMLTVDALGGDRYGVSIGNLAQRGIWRLVARTAKESPASGTGAKLLDTPLAANGPAEESELRFLREAGLRERLPEAEYRWVGQRESIRLTAGPASARDLWKWLMAAVLLGLFVETVLLAWPLARREPAAGRKDAAAGRLAEGRP